MTHVLRGATVGEVKPGPCPQSGRKVVSLLKMVLLATTLAVIVTCLGCDDASAKHSESAPKTPAPRVIALNSSEAAKVFTLLDKMNQLIIARKQLDADEEQLLTELKKAHELPATASVSINKQTGKLEESNNSERSCYSLGDGSGRTICN